MDSRRRNLAVSNPTGSSRDGHHAGQHPGGTERPSPTDDHFASAPMAMQIPGRRPPKAPPPLPPPRYVKLDEPAPLDGRYTSSDQRSSHHRYDHDSWRSSAGSDHASLYALGRDADSMTSSSNPGSARGASAVAAAALAEAEQRRRSSASSFKSSSTYQASLPPLQDPSSASHSRRASGQESGESERHNSATSLPSPAFRPPSDSDRRYEAASSRLQQDEGYYSLSVGSNLQAQQTSPRLSGERQLHHRDQEQSSQNYDKTLLSKIGKAGATVGRADSSPTSASAFDPRTSSQLHPLSLPNPHGEHLADENKFFNENPISPRSISSATSAKGPIDFRSPTYDKTLRSLPHPDGETLSPRYAHRTLASTAHDAPRQPKARRSGSGPLLFSLGDESASPRPKEAKRGSRAPNKPESDSTLRMEETVRHLHLEDRNPPVTSAEAGRFHFADVPPHPLHTSPSRSGMKRKQPPDGEADMPAVLAQQAVDQYASLPTHLSAQAANQYPQHQGSISSQSSGYRHDSYASSAGFSVGDGSYTSLEQPSPGGASPNPDPSHYPSLPAHESHYATFPMPAPSAGSRAGPYPGQPLPHEAPQPRSSSKQQGSRKSAGSSGNQGQWPCSCCPKKPRKFETREELMQHENEKQHECKFCHNKFKNKNEAERHQNSIHRKTASWSCAALGNDFHNAFFPASSIPSSASSGGPQSVPPNGVSFKDVCGYCGEEFSNDPPDWDRRQQHILSEHKFGDCNLGKKFYRADHFRQHLKHSHRGQNGKHTNQLEQICARDEMPAVQDDLSAASLAAAAAAAASGQSHGAPVANMSNLMGQPSAALAAAAAQLSSPQDAGAGHMQHPQLSPHHSHQSHQAANLGPYAASLDSAGAMGQIDMGNIDPSMMAVAMAAAPPGPGGAGQQQQQHQNLAMHGGGPGSGGGGGSGSSGGGGSRSRMKKEDALDGGF